MLKKILGWLILGLVFTSIFIYFKFVLGIVVTALAFCAGFGIGGLIILAVKLIDG